MSRQATLIVPYRGCRNIELLEKNQYKWTVRICGSGNELDVYEDEVILDDEDSSGRDRHTHSHLLEEIEEEIDAENNEK